MKDAMDAYVAMLHKVSTLNDQVEALQARMYSLECSISGDGRQDMDVMHGV